MKTAANSVAKTAWVGEQLAERWYRLSYGVAGLALLASLAGLLLPGSIYPSLALRRAFLSNDVVNLLVGLPVLLAAIALAHRRRLLGLLLWPGALLYFVYNYIAYGLALPVGALTLVYLAVVLLSLAIIAGLLRTIPAGQVREQLQGSVPVRLVGLTLLGFGMLFFMLALGKLAGHWTGQAPLPWPQPAVQIADLLTTPAWIIGGWLLFRRRALGYLSGGGLLFQASTLFFALLAFFLLQPVLEPGQPFALQDFLVIAGMSVICLLPLALWGRGVLQAEKA